MTALHLSKLTTEITGAVLLFRDITNRKQAQSPQLLLEQSKQLQAQLKNSKA